jgi:hypothetical protein
LVLAVSLWLCLAALPCTGQPKSEPKPQPLDRIQGEKEAHALVSDLLSRKPEQNSTNTGTLKIRDGEDKRREVPVRFEVFSTPTGWVSVYEVTPDGKAQAERLVVTHADGKPIQYQLVKGDDSKTLTGKEAQIPFAGSDFLATDLGLEFLRWPNQRVLKKEMRRSQFCDVLESVNPESFGYKRVVSWIDADTGGIVHAEAYNARNEKVKQFDPTELKKVNGQYQLEEMEIRDSKTGSHTWVKFNLKTATIHP